MIRSAMLTALMLATAACAIGPPAVPSQGLTPLAQQSLLREAAIFMADYADRIRAGDRAGIAALYDPVGSILIRGGRRIVASQDDMVRRYARPEWQPPSQFDWRDLHFEPAGPDSVVVLGKFAWRVSDGPAEIGTYNALLRRFDGRLVIRIEDEAADQSAT
jgi:hypothetical protein